MYRALATISVWVSRPTSEKPCSAEVSDPVMYTALKPTDSAILAWRAFKQKGATTIPSVFSIARSLVVRSFVMLVLLFMKRGLPTPDMPGAEDLICCY